MPPDILFLAQMLMTLSGFQSMSISEARRQRIPLISGTTKSSSRSMVNSVRIMSTNLRLFLGSSEQDAERRNYLIPCPLSLKSVPSSSVSRSFCL